MTATRGVAGLWETPIVGAPHGGGPSTPALAAAVSEADGLGFVAAGYKTVAAVEAELEARTEPGERPSWDRQVTARRRGHKQLARPHQELIRE
jgi:NAD(P)H-dependent flavin oxidoreductase YrpB (nitropropane dioxygenase family)